MSNEIAEVQTEMTRLLEKAFEEASKLPDTEQDALAELLLSELASEKRWEEAFAKSQDELALLADEALREFKQGKTVEIKEGSDFSHN